MLLNCINFVTNDGRVMASKIKIIFYSLIIFLILQIERKERIMAIPVTNIPVLTGEVAEHFIKQCEYNAKHLAGSEWSQEREDWFNRIMERSIEFQRKMARK